MDALLLMAVVPDVRRLLGVPLDEVGPWGPRGLCLGFGEPAGRVLGIAADDVLPRACLDVVPSGRTGPELFPQLARDRLRGSRLAGVEHEGLDRFLALEFVSVAGDRYRLAAELFGRQPNLVLLDQQGRVLGSARTSGAGSRSPVASQPYLRPPLARHPDAARVPDAATLAGLLEPGLAAGLDPAAAVVATLSGVSRLWAEEVVARADAPSAASLAAALQALLARVTAGPLDPRLVLDPEGQPAEVVPIPLLAVPADRQPAVPSLAAGLEQLVRHRARTARLAERRERLSRVLRRVEARLAALLQHLREDAEEASRADRYQQMGEALIQHQAEVPRGSSEAVLPDVRQDPPGQLVIPLDPTETVLANAERLFRRARRARRGALRIAERLEQTERQFAAVRALHARLDPRGGREELEAVQRELEARRLLSPQDRVLLAGEQPAREPGARPTGARRGQGGAGELEPRRFLSSDGLPILVGRSPEGNDHLTAHLAKSNDLWLHVQGRPGSHVVVRSGNRQGGVPRRTLVQAAQLAAYYSQAREDGKVPVDYTLRKFVRKPRKAKPGLVTISQEKTLIVTPDKALVTKLAATPGR